MTEQINDQPEQVPPALPDLIEAVRQSLVSSGLVKQCNNAFLPHPLVLAAMGQHPFQQRVNLNAFFLYQLAPFGVESMEERYCLVNDGTPDEWLRLFKDKILPFLISKNLPTLIH